MSRNQDPRTSGCFSYLSYDQDSLLVKLFLWIAKLRYWQQRPRRRGRPWVYPWPAIFRGLLFMILKHLRRIPALDRALRQSVRYRWLCGFQRQLPCQRTWYRRFQQLEIIVATLKNVLLRRIVKEPEALRIGVADASAIRSYGRHVSKKRRNTGKYKPGDRDASWGKTVTHGWFQGYKLHCLNTSRPHRVPIAWQLGSGSSQEARYLEGLLDKAKSSRFLPRYLTADKAYDAEHLFEGARQRGVFLAAMLRRIRAPSPKSRKATASRPYRKRWSLSPFARYVFKRRSDIERWFSHLKETFLLDPLPVRHWPNVEAYTHLCLLGYLALVAFNVSHKRPALKLQDILCSF